jgi:hypothetical protein
MVRLGISGLLDRLNASLRLLGFSPIARALVPLGLTLEPRPLCSTVVTRFHAPIGLSDFPSRPAQILTDRRLPGLLPRHGKGSPVLTRESLARMSTSLPRRLGPVLLLLASRTNGGLRPFIAGSALTLAVSRPARAFTHVSTCVLAGSLSEPFAPEASTRSVTSPSRSGCFRLEQQLPGGIPSSHGILAPFSRRTIKSN